MTLPHNPPSGLHRYLPALYAKSPWIILAVFLLLMVTVIMRWDEYESGKRVQETNNAYVHFDTISIEAKVSGYVKTVAFTDFQTIADGGLLVVIDDADYRMAVLQAEAKRDYAAATLANLELEERLQEAQVEQAGAVAAITQARLELARKEHNRLSRLVKQGAVATHEADTAETNLKAADASHRESTALVQVQERKLILLSNDKALREANLKAAEAVLEAARIDLAHTRISAPTASFAGACKIREGDLVKVGTPVVTLVPDAAPYVIANYKETQLTNIQPGQVVEVAVDTFPGQVLKGRVSSVSPATGATYSLLPKDNSSGNFTKVVQRIPVRIELEPDQSLLSGLRAGMSVTAFVDTSDTTHAGMSMDPAHADSVKAGKRGPVPYASWESVPVPGPVLAGMPETDAANGISAE